MLSEAHLCGLLRASLAYCNTVRPHQALDNNCPPPREVQPPARGRVMVDPVGRRAPSPRRARGLIAVGSGRRSPRRVTCDTTCDGVTVEFRFIRLFRG